MLQTIEPEDLVRTVLSKLKLSQCADIDSVAQEIRIYQYQHPEQSGGLLVVSAYRRAIDYIRQSGPLKRCELERREKLGLEKYDTNIIDDNLKDFNPTPSQSLDQKDELENNLKILKIGLDSLGKRKRMVIEDLFFKGLDGVQIGKKLGVSHAMVSLIKIQAIKEIRKVFELKGQKMIKTSNNPNYFSTNN